MLWPIEFIEPPIFVGTRRSLQSEDVAPKTWHCDSSTHRPELPVQPELENYTFLTLGASVLGTNVYADPKGLILRRFSNTAS